MTERTLPCSGNFERLLRPLVPSNIETLEVIVSRRLALARRRPCGLGYGQLVRAGQLSIGVCPGIEASIRSGFSEMIRPLHFRDAPCQSDRFIHIVFGAERVMSPQRY